MKFVAIVSRGDCFIRYLESLKQVEDKYILILDFDGFANNTTATEVLTTTDKLHDIISREYELTIKEPVYRYMRGE
jgi:hypothetical protein